MHPILAALIPTLLLSFSILYLIVRLRNKQSRIIELEKQLSKPTPKVIHRADTGSTATPAAPAIVAKESKKTKSDAEIKREAVYFDSSDSLIATLSHELKTPLNGMMAIAQMLREANEDSDLITELEGCGHHMHSVLHTLTNLARIQNEKEFLPQYREWVSLRDTIEQIREDVTFRAGGRQLNIKTEHENTRTRLRGDSDHINTIIKSAVLGSVEAVEMCDLPEEKQTLSISWAITDSVIELHITNPLETLEDERDACINNILHIASGIESSRIKIEYLHFAVAKALLGYYEGSLDFEKASEGGVRTTVRFSMEQMTASPSAAKPIGGLRVQSGKSGITTLRELPEKMKILVAEDNRTNQKILLILLEKMGQVATLVENGEKAIAELQKTPDYDLILMDVDMPVMDGMEATKAIRAGQAGEEAKNIPIVAVTAFNVLSDRSRFKEMGMGYYLPKPVGLKELRATLLEVVKSKKAEA